MTLLLIEGGRRWYHRGVMTTVSVSNQSRIRRKGSKMDKFTFFRRLFGVSSGYEAGPPRSATVWVGLHTTLQ